MLVEMRNTLKLQEEVNLKGLGVHGKTVLKWILEKCVSACPGFIWLRMDISGRLLWTWQQSFSFHKRWETP
jgi:hypothetical protein